MDLFATPRALIARILGVTHGGTRDTYAAFGYPHELRFDDFLAMYQRGGIASRIVKAPTQSTWRDIPVIRDEKGDSAKKTDKDGNPNKNYSPFVEKVETFFDANNVFHYLERADRIAGIGQYSILVMGFADGLDLSRPMSGKHKLIYLQPYSEKSAQIASFENNPANPRYGLPLTYRVQQSTPSAGGRVMSRAISVHHSRVLHIAENLEENDVYGMPRLLSVFNNLIDLHKVSGASAETFWLNSRPGVNFSIDKDATIDAETKAAMKQQVEDFSNQLKRYMTTQGVTAQTINAQIADPKSNFDILISQIAGAAGIPQRILIGNEQGQLASGQDENNWSDRVKERRENYATPRILNPFVKKMIETGNLDQPNGTFWIEWPETALPPEKIAALNLQKAQTLSAYANSPAAATIVPEAEFRTDFLGMSPESEYETEEQDDIDETDPETVDQFDSRDEPERDEAA